MEEIPLVNFHFQVEWGGTKIAFTEITGLEMEHEVLEYRHGASPEFSVQKIPGLTKYSNIVLKRGLFEDDNEYYAWFKEIRDSSKRRDIVIKLLNEDHNPVFVWKVRDAWPTFIQYSKLHATQTAVMIEQMELAHEGIIAENVGGK